ncbi:MAG: ComF family protein [Ignavibacteriales bacterium]|nr:ComF family protein [Ignavibacteriales bacterium]
MNLANTILDPINDFFFLTTCFHCGNRLSDGESRVCATCWSSLTPVRNDDFTYQVMIKRFQDAGIIDEFIPLYYFEKGKMLQSLAHSLKYEEITSFGKELGEKIGAALKTKNITAAAVIPVPLNKRKERERGYNQSEFIAEGVSRVTGIPVLPQAVRRVKYTVTQTHLNAEERKENIADAFIADERYKEKIANKVVIVVDDIITTGSTIQEIGKVLKDAGAKKIIAASAGLAKLGEDA